jgi:hypothetical protein
MEKLEEQIREREAACIRTILAIINQEGTDRVKLQLIYRQHIKCSLAIEDIVIDAQMEGTPAYAVEHLEVSSPAF